MNVALDSNRYSDLQRALPDVVAQLEVADTVVLPFVVLAELRAGFLSMANEHGGAPRVPDL